MATKFEVVLTAKLDESSVRDIQKQINSIVKNQDISIKADNKQVNSLTKSLQSLGEEAKNAKGHTQGLSDIVSKFSSWQVVGDVIHGVKDAMSDMVQQVFDLDESLTELDKVTDLTSSGLQSLADDAFSVGQQIGATGKDVIDATTLFAQAGYEAQDALDLGEQAIMLKNVSEAGATAEGSASTLIAAMKAFGLEADSSSHIVDALNEVSNKYAVSVNDLSTAISKSSASMAAGNNTLEETFGLVTAGTEILREPGRVANGLSTITARLTAENDEYIASITGGQGVIDKQTGELRSTFDILQDLAGAWDTLTSVEKQELAETVAGKTQRSLFTAIMTNFESAVGATEAALESEGSAAAENEKRMNSLQGRMQQLEGAWQSFARNTIDSDFIKNILSATTSLIEFIDKIGGLPVVLATATAALMAFKGGLIVDKAIKIFTSGLGIIKNGLTTLIMALPNAVAAFKSFSAGVISAGTAIQAAVPLLSVIALAITGVVAAVNYFTQAQKEATAAAIESSQEADKEIQSKKDKIKTTEDEIKKLSEERDALLKVADAGGEDAQASRNLAQDKQEEIDKRQQNIDKIQQETDELLKQREAAARSMTTNKVSGAGLGGATETWFTPLSGDQYNEFTEFVDDANEKLKGLKDNTGAYKQELESLRSEYEKQAQEKEKNGENIRAEEEMIKLLNAELERNSENYEEDAKTAEEFYDILLDGGEITQENKDWLQEFYDLTDEQMQQLSEGKDVYAEMSETAEEAYDRIASAIDKASEAQQNYEGIIDSNIDKVASYSDNLSILTEAQDMLTESGHLTAEMYQQLSDNNLLQYLDVVNGKLVVNKDAFDMSSQAALDNATQAAKDSLAQQLLQIALADQNGTLDETAQKLGLVSSESNGVDTTHAVDQMLKIGAAASSSKAKLGALFKTMEAGEEVATDYSPSSQAQGLMNEAISRTNAQIAAIQSISLGSFKSSGSGGSGRKSSGGSGKKSSGGSSSKSAKEEYKAEVDALYWYKNALDNAEESVDKLNDALKNTDNFNEQEKYLNQLIEATNNQINKTNDLKNAQVGQINDFINQLRQQGFAIDYNSQNNELYINNMQHLSDFTGDAAKNVEDLIDKIQDLNDDNRDLDGSIRDLTADVKDYYDQLAEIPEKKLEKFNDLMEEFQQSRLDQVQYQIEDLEHEMKNDPRLKALEEQIAALEKQNDEIDKQQEMEEKLLAVEEAKLKLQNAQQQKTLQVYREGQGFVWEADPDAIKEAQEELEDAQKDLNEQIKDDQLEQLEEEKEAIEKSYQDRIDALQNFLDEQEYLIDKANREGIQTFEELRNELAKYGLDSAEYLGKATDWLNNYNSALANLNNTVQGILASSGDATSELIYSSAMQSRINQALSNALPEVATNSSMFGSGINYDKVSSSSSQTVYINTVELPNVQDSEDFISELKNLPRMATSQSALRQ